MDPLLEKQALLHRSLQYYKRREVQEAILRHAVDREVSPRYGEGFGKRPDALSYPQDILEFAKRKATSFHVSEERWENPLDIKTGASRKEANELRKGWDLVLDIDAKDWDLSRMTAWIFIEALKAHGVYGISVKFSGNKGWHIGVPFEAFPAVYTDASGKEIATKDMFPELPRLIATYLLDFIDDTQNGLITIDQDKVIFGWNRSKAMPFEGMGEESMSFSLQGLEEISHKGRKEFLSDFCNLCNKVVDLGDEQYALICQQPDCMHRSPKKYSREEKMLGDARDEAIFRELVCPRCKHDMIFVSTRKNSCPHAEFSPRPYRYKFKLDAIVQFDTILIAGRHLYRMPYSLHEKSGLASVVVDPSVVLTFDKGDADPKAISFERMFLDPALARRGEAETLLHKALLGSEAKEERKERSASKMQLTEFEEVTDAVPEEHFPPCMKTILEGMTDGKKRAMFALTNFLSTVGWSPEMIEKRLHDWNEKNPEQLREVIIKGHMHSVKQKKERMPPPNCRAFYQELGVCKPDEFCSRIKNPAPYAIKHSKLAKPAKAKKAKSLKKEKVVKGEETVQETGQEVGQEGNHRI